MPDGLRMARVAQAAAVPRPAHVDPIAAGETSGPRPLPRRAPGTRREVLLAVLLTACAATLILVTTARHEMWADELKPWVLARGSGSVMELLRNIRYEGHPALWYLVLFPLSRFTRDPLAMQLVNAVFAIATIYLVARFSPFSWLQRTLFAFGYFAVYGYGTVARNYGLGMLLVVAACISYDRSRARNSSLLPLAVLLALLALTSVYGVILAGTFGVALLADALIQTQTEEVAPSTAARIRRLVPVIVLGLTGAAIAVAQMLRARATFAGNGVVATGVVNAKDYIPSLLPVWSAYFPIPRLDRVPLVWNSDVGLALANTISRGIILNVLVLALLLTVLVSLARRPVAMLFYFAGTGGILLFSHLVFSGALYHYGHLFLVLIASFWLAEFYEDSTPPALPFASAGLPRARIRSGLLTTVLAAQMVAGLMMSVNDMIWTFSPGKQIASILASPRYATIPVVGQGGPVSETVSGYLDRPVTRIETRGGQTGAAKNSPSLHIASRDSLLRAALDQRLTPTQPAVAVVLDRDLNTGSLPGMMATRLLRTVALIGPPVASRLYIVRRIAR